MNKEFLQNLTMFVEANLANENYGIEDLAREMGMSRSSLHRKLRVATNQNISQFVREVRLKKARELLLDGDLTVAEIAYRVGFGSPTYFNKCFHQYYGYTPGELRNHSQKLENEENIIPTSEKQKRPKLALVFVFCVLFLVPLFFFLIYRVSVSKAEPASEKSIAVLPFKYLGAEADKQYLADGTMDAILMQLSKIKELRVISRTSVEQYRNTHKTTHSIGQELGVSYILEGSFQKDADRIRLILQLIKTSDDGHLWSGEYDREWKDVFSVQSEVAETIASELDVLITPEEKQMMRKVPTANLTAYDFFQRGKDELSKLVANNSNNETSDKAIYYFYKTLEYDPKFALACSQLALTYLYKWSVKYTEIYLDSMIYYSNKAISMDDKIAEAYAIRACFYRVTNRPDQAVKDCDKAINIDPNEWGAYMSKAIIYQWEINDFVKAISNYYEASLRNRGKELPEFFKRIGLTFLDAGFIEKSREYYRKALELDGDSANYFSNICFTFACAEDLKEALKFATKAYQANSIYIYDLAFYYSFLRNDRESFRFAEKFVNTFGPSAYDANRIGYAYWKVGKTKEAKVYFDHQIECTIKKWEKKGGPPQGGDYYYPASVYAILGDKENAYKCLNEFSKRKAFALRWVIFLKYDPMFDGIRKEPRFQTILRDVESKYQTEHERVGEWLSSQKI
jgi:TolB-like protein/AraC-like DNA-binding protein